MLQITFISRYQFEKLETVQQDWLAISIGDPDQTAPKQVELFDAHARLVFLDLLIDHPRAFNETIGNQLITFLKEHVTAKTKGILVHCEAGVSRSAAIALATAGLVDGYVTNHDHADFANQRVIAILERLTGIPIVIPPHPCSNDLADIF